MLLVESIEPSLPFWVDRLGFARAAEVPDGHGLGFVMLTSGEAVVMLQTFASAARDEPRFVAGPGHHRTSLFVTVDDWADVLRRLDGYPIAMPQRDTFYGMREVGVFEPGGHVVVFAKQL